VARLAFARSRSPGARTTRERFRLSKQCTHDERGARSRFEEGPRPNETSARTFARINPVPQARFFGGLNLRGSSARTVPARGRPEVKVAGGVVASRCSTRNRRGSW